MLLKLYYSNLQFELTRRCNQECGHCCRGESQNLDLTEQIVDAFFEKNEIHSIDTLMFSGGEPTLNGKLLEYIVDKIIEKEVMVNMFNLGINGLSYSEELINGLNKLKDYIIFKSEKERYCPGVLMISQDQFHKEADPKVIQKLEGLSYFSPVKKIIIDEEDILPYGRAYKNKLSIEEPNLEELTNYQKNYEIKEHKGNTYLIISYQYIAANGNVINDGCQSYDLMDEYRLGNVSSQKIEDMYLNEKEKVLKIK